MSWPFLVLALTALAGLAAQAGRTLTVGAGQDHADIASALAEARAGDTVEVHGGVHRGPIVVEAAVALVGRDDPVIDGGGEGTVVTFMAPGGRIEGFTIRDSGRRMDKEDAGIAAKGTVEVRDNRLEEVLFGIDLERAPGSTVAGNRISGHALEHARMGDGIRLWESAGSRVEDNQIAGMRDLVIWYSENVLLRGNHVRDGRYGLHFMYAAGSRVEENRFERNSVGAYAMYSADLHYRGNAFLGNHGPSGYGLALKDSDRIRVEENVLAGNRVGIYFDNSPLAPDAFNRITGNTVAFNDIGMAFVPSVKRNIFAANNFVENFQQVAVLGSGQFEGNDWTPDGRGNFWSGYAGYDADGDGLGDLPYQELSLFDSLLEERPDLRLFILSPAQQALDLAARAFPVFRPPPTLTDQAPRIVPVEVPVPVPASPRWPLALLGLGLLALAAAVAVWGRRMDARARGARPAGARALGSEGPA